jgi:predicted kinase
VKVVILRGMSGAGKSTYAKKNYPNAYVVSADTYHMVDGEYRFDPANAGKAHAQCLRGFTAFIVNKHGTEDQIVVDNTNTTVAEVAPYAALALAYGCELEIVTLDTPFDKAHGRNVHSVPLNVAKAQWERLHQESAGFPKWWPQRLVFDNQDLGFVKTHS